MHSPLSVTDVKISTLFHLISDGPPQNQQCIPAACIRRPFARNALCMHPITFLLPKEHLKVSLMDYSIRPLWLRLYVLYRCYFRNLHMWTNLKIVKREKLPGKKIHMWNHASLSPAQALACFPSALSVIVCIFSPAVRNYCQNLPDLPMSKDNPFFHRDAFTLPSRSHPIPRLRSPSAVLTCCFSKCLHPQYQGLLPQSCICTPLRHA